MRVELAPIEVWRHELCGCLQASLATVLLHRGLEPLEVLGAWWGFDDRQDVRSEEYYFPSRAASLVESLVPYHPIRSAWHEPEDDVRGWEEVRDAVRRGAPTIVAVDNFHLPFRPAYRDVHTNHLLVVYGFDERADEVLVLDAIPPSYRGPLRRRDLDAARASAAPRIHDRDLFFAGTPIARRWLEVLVGDVRPMDPPTLLAIVRQNVAAFTASPSTGARAGLRGQAEWLEATISRARRHDPKLYEELFVFAGAMLASAALHADLLGRSARSLSVPALAPLARSVERVAHHWTAIRIIAGRGPRDPIGMVHLLRARAGALEADTMRAVDALAAFSERHR